MITYLKNTEGWKHKDLKSKYFDSIKELFNKAFKRVNMFVDYRTDLVEGSSKRAREELEQESTKKQKVDEDKDTSELQSLMEVIPDEEDVAIDDVPLATKSPSIVDWKIHKEGKKSYYQIMRADGKSQMYRVFNLMLKSFSREDLEDLYKLVKAKYESTRPVEDLDLLLWGDLKTMFDPYGRIVGIKSLLNVVSITAALIDVNAAQSKLVLLENFNENYSKCLRLLYKVNAAKGVNAASEEVSTTELVSTAYVIGEDGVTGIKRSRRDLSSDGVRNLATALGRDRLKEDLESSIWRRHSVRAGNVRILAGKTLRFAAMTDASTFSSYSLSEPFRFVYQLLRTQDATVIDLYLKLLFERKLYRIEILLFECGSLYVSE
ncbi:hypothetical protein Tco_0796520 [Tanacetum coccineum]